MSAARYIIFTTEPDSKTMLVTTPTANDLEFADVGIYEIVRLADLHRYVRGEWHPIPRGVLTTAHGRDYPDKRPYHHVPNDAARVSSARRAS